MIGPGLLVRTMSVPRKIGRFPLPLAYHSRSDQHSKVACWGVLVDLLSSTPLLREQVAAGKIGFGINHTITDFQQNRRKALDLVVCTPNSSGPSSHSPRSFASLADHYQMELGPEERAVLDALPALMETPVGSLLIALEAKACMTAHQKAAPRLYDELNSSHQIVHGSTSQALAVGLVMVNIAVSFVSPDSNEHLLKVPEAEVTISRHDQPRDADLVISKVEHLPRRSRTSQEGFDGLAVLIVDCDNQGSPVTLHEGPPAPLASSPFHYDAMIHRIAGEYATRFQGL